MLQFEKMNLLGSYNYFRLLLSLTQLLYAFSRFVSNYAYVIEHVTTRGLDSNFRHKNHRHETVKSLKWQHRRGSVQE